MDTNGFDCIKHVEYLKYFDMVCFSHYIKGDYFTDKEDNTDILNFLQKRKDIRLVVFDINYFDSRNNTNSKPCYRLNFETISYVDGLIYPCCIGVGNRNAKGITPSDNWKTEILTAPLDCNGCLFATK